jgi:hypothetical protein
MSNHSLHNKFLDTKTINRINDGILVLKHFLKLNKELLPLYYDLHERQEQTSETIASIIKIDSVFSSFKFDALTSKFLMDSSILEDIKNAYYTIQSSSRNTEEKTAALSNFDKELERLKSNWDLVQAN